MATINHSTQAYGTDRKVITWANITAADVGQPYDTGIDLLISIQLIRNSGDVRMTVKFANTPAIPLDDRGYKYIDEINRDNEMFPLPGGANTRWVWPKGSVGPGAGLGSFTMHALIAPAALVP